MTDKEIPHGEHGILELIATLSAKAASGRLEVLAGATAGVLFFKNGKLVDARMGHLSGFQAVNAITSLPDARLRFDPSVAPPVSSSITASERLVLKQFFGIETVGSRDEAVGSGDYATPAGTDELAMPVSANEVGETTVVRNDVTKVPAATAPTRADIGSTTPADTAPPANVVAESAPSYGSASWLPYAAAFALGVFVLTIAAAAVLLRGEFRERNSKVSVATAEPVVKSESPVVASEARVKDTPTSTVNETPVPAEKPAAPASGAVNEIPSSNPEKKTSATAATDMNRTDQNGTADLNGTWNVVNTVDTTSYKSFQNLRIGFVVSISQTGTTFTATGQKVSENGRRLPANSRTPIQLRGVIKGDRVEATFFENGATRRTNGKFVWKLNRAGGGLTGTFASSAARTSGKSTARRDI